MKKILLGAFVFLMLLALIFWSSPLIFLKFFSKEGSINNSSLENQNNQNKQLNMDGFKKILMVVAFSNFRDEEYFEPKKIFEKNGFLVETISSKTGKAISTDQNTVDISKTPADIDPDEYLAIVFVGGPGMVKELDNASFQRLAKEFYNRNKLVAAICIAPALLAKAGILENKRATVWSSSADQSALKIFEEKGVIYEDKPVVRDGFLITANGPQAAQDFGEAIVNYLNANF